tara:strand:- start:1030 stop:2664 length:1635 start_codon:yes stop_codon:yes gene_type:complete
MRVKKKEKPMFSSQGTINYKFEENKNSYPICDLEDGVNFTKNFIIYKDEDLIKVYSRKCDHNGGKLCKLEGKIACPLHGWEFSPESGSYTNIQLAKKEEDFYIDEDHIFIPFQQEILTLPSVDKDYEISVELLSHACLLFKAKEFSFATDPWIEGFAFSSGWWPSQLPPKNWQDELNKVDFIYISHNHPDHLNKFTLEKIRKDMHFIVPEFSNDSVRKLLNKFGFYNITSFDFSSYYRFRDTDLFFTILKSGDFREDSGFHFTYGNFSCLSTVDSNNLNFLKFPENISLFCSSFAGGASGYPLCFDTIDEKKKPEIIARNLSAEKSTVKGHIKICNARYYLPYAGFFSERAPRDADIKLLNQKNKASDYVLSLKSSEVLVLDPTKNDSFLFGGNELQKIKKLERHDDFSEDPTTFYKTEFSGIEISNNFIEEFFKNSKFQDDLKVYFELTNDDFSKTNRYILVDFSQGISVTFEKFDWDLIKNLYVQGSRLRHLRIKVRQDSMCWVLQNNLPFEDLSIGFQCRLDRVPDIYNIKFWDHFTSVYI